MSRGLGDVYKRQALPGHTFGNLQGLRYRCQEADRHKFGGDQSEDAQRHGKDATPVSGRLSASGSFCSVLVCLVTHLRLSFQWLTLTFSSHYCYQYAAG